MRDPSYAIVREGERKIDQLARDIEKKDSIGTYRAASLIREAFEAGVKVGREAKKAASQVTQ